MSGTAPGISINHNRRDIRSRLWHDFGILDQRVMLRRCARKASQTPILIAMPERSRKSLCLNVHNIELNNQYHRMGEGIEQSVISEIGVRFSAVDV